MESEFVNLNEFMGVVGTVVKKKKNFDVNICRRMAYNI